MEPRKVRARSVVAVWLALSATLAAQQFGRALPTPAEIEVNSSALAGSPATQSGVSPSSGRDWRGTLEFADVSHVMVAQSAPSGPLPGSTLPDAPVPAPARTRLDSPPESVGGEQPQPAIRNADRVDFAYWAVETVSVASFVAAAEVTQRCFGAGGCTVIPTPLQSRAAIYSVGLPATTGVAYLSHLMKKHGSRWWYVPSTMFISANVIMAIHAARVAH